MFPNSLSDLAIVLVKSCFKTKSNERLAKYLGTSCAVKNVLV